MSNLAFIGNTGSSEMMSGVGLGDTALTFMGWWAMIGMNNAIESLVSQAVGAKNIQLAGVYLNQGRLLLTLFFIPVLFLTFYIETILVYFK